MPNFSNTKSRINAADVGSWMRLSETRRLKRDSVLRTALRNGITFSMSESLKACTTYGQGDSIDGDRGIRDVR